MRPAERCEVLEEAAMAFIEVNGVRLFWHEAGESATATGLRH